LRALPDPVDADLKLIRRDRIGGLYQYSQSRMRWPAESFRHRHASTRLSRDAEVGGEVQLDAGVLGQPAANDWVLVGGVVVADHMQATAPVNTGDLLEEG